jgi:hypothetical protein
MIPGKSAEDAVKYILWKRAGREEICQGQ